MSELTKISYQKVLPFILRRMKRDVLSDLPPKITQDYYCELSPVQARLYEDFAKERSNNLVSPAEKKASSAQKSHIFQALQYLRKVCNHPKLVLNDEHDKFLEVQQMLRSSNTTLDDISHSGKLPALKDLLQQCGIGTTTGTAESGGEGNVVSQHRALIFFQVR